MQLMLKTIALWFVLALLAVLNGTLREKGLVPLLGTGLALPLSGVLLSLMIFAVSWLALPWRGPLGALHYWLIGSAWLIMTLLFEFGFGRYVAGKTWDELLEAYNVMKGNLWLLVLASTLLSPYLAARLRGYV